MQLPVQMETHSADARPLRSMAVDRVRFSLRRLGGLVRRARVRLLDVNGPRGGIDKQVRLELHTTGPHGSSDLVVDAVAADWRTALDAALARAAQALRRQWQRDRSKPRVSLRRLAPTE